MKRFLHTRTPQLPRDERTDKALLAEFAGYYDQYTAAVAAFPVVPGDAHGDERGEDSGAVLSAAALGWYEAGLEVSRRGLLGEAPTSAREAFVEYDLLSTAIGHGRLTGNASRAGGSTGSSHSNGGNNGSNNNNNNDNGSPNANAGSAGGKVSALATRPFSPVAFAHAMAQNPVVTREQMEADEATALKTNPEQAPRTSS